MRTDRYKRPKVATLKNQAQPGPFETRQSETQQLAYLNIIVPDESAYRHAGLSQVSGRIKRSRLIVKNHNIAGHESVQEKIVKCLFTGGVRCQQEAKVQRSW